jgi:hypothetical protein
MASPSFARPRCDRGRAAARGNVGVGGYFAGRGSGPGVGHAGETEQAPSSEAGNAELLGHAESGGGGMRDSQLRLPCP